MKKPIKFLGWISLLFLGSCASVYGPSRSAYDLGYTARPVYQGEKITNFQGALQFNSDNGFNQNEIQNGGEASISVHSINEKVGYSLGGFGFVSSYTIRTTDQRYSAYGYGGRLSIYKNSELNNLQWRPYGLELGASVERGTFQSFRKEQTQTSNVPENTFIPSIGVSSEIVYSPHFLDNFSLGARGVVGGSYYQLGNEANTLHPFIMVSPFLNWDRYSAYANLKFDRRFGASIGASFRL